MMLEGDVRILLITPYYKPAYVYGGPAHSIPTLCEGLVKLGASVTVFTTNANGPGKVVEVATNHPIDIDGVRVSYFPVYWPLARIYPFYSPKLGQVCNSKNLHYDVIYIAGNWTYPVLKGAYLAKQTMTPYIISPRGSFMIWSMGEKMLKKRIYLTLFEREVVNHAAAIHVTSHLEKTQLQNWNFSPPVVTIPNGINRTFFTCRPRRGKLRDSLGIRKDDTISLFVGRLHKEKRLELIIESFVKVSQNLSNAHLVIVGSDQDGSEKVARDLVARLSLSRQVHFLGPLHGNDLLQAYVDADLLVLMSYRENFGMVILEAMAVGLPVLLTREVGLAQEIEQAESGLVVNADPLDVAESWMKLLKSPEVRDAMGGRGMAMVGDKFDADIVASRMWDLFRVAIENKQIHQ